MSLVSITKSLVKKNLIDVYNCTCDNCGKNVTITKQKIGEKSLHFCSKECAAQSAKVGGKLHEQVTLSKKKNHPEMYDVVDFDEVTKTWTRVCPKCHETVFHKSKNKALAGKRHNKLCTKCNRSAIGKKNIQTDTCPICNELIHIPSTNKIELTSHAKSHQLTPEDLWLIKFGKQPSYCKCGCGEKLEWTGWWGDGYDTFIFGHQSKLAKKGNRGKNWREAPYWKGKTKETDEKCANRGKATSKGLKMAFDEGKIHCWSKGLTKETDDRLMACSEKSKQDYKEGKRTGWAVGLTKESDARIANAAQKQKDKFKSGEIVPWHKGHSIKDDPRIAKFWQSRDHLKFCEQVRWSHDEIADLLKKNICLIFENIIENYKNYFTASIWVKCSNCDYRDKVALYVAQSDRCPKCNPIGSLGQIHITNWLSLLGVSLKTNVKKLAPGRQEIDILIPDANLAIEYNGLFYHNVKAGKDKFYHQNKTDACSDAGISLFHVFEDDWLKKQDIVKSMILHRLKMTPQKIYARKCSIIELSDEQKCDFFEKNHIDGDTTSFISFGLLYNNDTIICAISLRKPLFNKRYELEVARSCSIINTIVSGGLSKLTSHVVKWMRENNHNNIMTYVDMRFGNGKSYETSGWKYSGITPSRFWWTDCHRRFYRGKFKANKPLGLTEKQVAEAAGVVKVYGCRNLVYEIKL